jgi:hypothetical protein
VPNIKKGRLTLSGVYMVNLTLEEWKRINSPDQQGKAPNLDRDPLADTSLRQFKRGTVLNYGLSVFNAKADPSGRSGVTSQIRLFRDGKQIFEGKVQPVPPSKPDSGAVDIVSSLVLGTEMTPGDYVLQITVTDTLAKEKYRSTSQFVQFEIVE